MDEKEPTQVRLEPGVETRVRNSNPMTWDVKIETEAGSVISFTVPAGGSFAITPNEAFRDLSITCGDLVSYGPRPVDQD